MPPWETVSLHGGRKDILLSLAIIVVPNVALSAVLLGLIFHYQVPQTYSELPGIPDPLARDSSAFLVNLSATKLLTVASWASTVSSLLPGFVMVLVSYPVARNILNASKNKKTEDLPTPYQLSMLLGVLSGSIGSLWNWFKYMTWKKRDLVNGVAKGTITWLVCVSVLGYLIIAADTWLHISTSTIQLSQALPGQSVSSFGRGLNSSECFDNRPIYPCSVAVGAHGPHFNNAGEGFQTLANTSTRNSVLSFVHDGQSYALITDANVPQETSYQAQTFAVTTQCSIISEKCGAGSWTNGPPGPWNCSESFSGDMPNYKYFDEGFFINPSWGLAGVEFFQDPGLTQNFTVGSGIGSQFNFTTANPVYIGAFGFILGFFYGDTALLDYGGDFTIPQIPGLGFILGCNMTTYDLEYVWSNGSVLVQKMEQSNTSVVSILTAPFVVQLANLVSLGQSAAGESTPSAFLDNWTTGFSAMVLALSAGIMTPRATIKEQAYISTLVARVPKAPLAVLVALTLIYGAVGILLACMAARAGVGETKDVQGRLSVAGLAAKCFESEERHEGPTKEIYGLFAESEVRTKAQRSSKVSIIASRRGGWKYESIE